MGILLQQAKRNGAYVAMGASMFQGYPNHNINEPGNNFADSGMNVAAIPGYLGNDSINLNGRTYTQMQNSFYKYETFNDDYFYYLDYSFDLPSGLNYNDITTYPQLWQYINTGNVFAAEVGHITENQAHMRYIHGGNVIPSVRQTQIYYEKGDFPPSAFGVGTEHNRVWQPPYLNRIIQLTSQFLNGEMPGSGFFLFANWVWPGSPRGVISTGQQQTDSSLNFHLHGLESLGFHASEFNSHLWLLSDSTLTTTIDMKFGGNGNWQTVTGPSAFMNNTPCAITRHRQTSTGLYVLFMVGYNQSWDSVRTDHIRIPNVMSTNIIEVTYKGKDVAVFEVFIPNGTNNTTYTARSIVPSWERKGYGGIII